MEWCLHTSEGAAYMVVCSFVLYSIGGPDPGPLVSV